MYHKTYIFTKILFIACTFNFIDGIRVHKLFQFIDGYRSEHNLKGFLHVGKDYAVFLQAPKPGDKFLVYELYEARHISDPAQRKPKLLAISRVPIEYMKEQLKTFRDELYNAKYVDDNVIPGTQVKTMREWQIEKALQSNPDMGVVLSNKAPILRSLIS